MPDKCPWCDADRNRDGVCETCMPLRETHESNADREAEQFWIDLGGEG